MAKLYSWLPPEFRVARGPISWLLSICGFAAITLPWRRVYILENYCHLFPVIRHEQVHLKQIDRHGPVGFTVRYFWLLARYGYRNNPMEIEATTAETPVRISKLGD